MNLQTFLNTVIRVVDNTILTILVIFYDAVGIEFFHPQSTIEMVATYMSLLFIDMYIFITFKK